MSHHPSVDTPKHIKLIQKSREYADFKISELHTYIINYIHGLITFHLITK